MLIQLNTCIKQPLMQRRILVFLFSALLLLVILTAYISIISIDKTDRLWEKVNQSHNIIKHGESFLASLRAVESSARGYLLTGNNRFHEDFNQAEQNLPLAYNKLKYSASLTQENLQHLHEIEYLLAQKHAFNQTNIRLFQSGQETLARANLAQGNGINLMNKIEYHIKAINNNETLLLSYRIQKANSSSSQASITIFILFACCIFLFLTVFSFYNKNYQQTLRENQLLAENEKRNKAILENSPDAITLLSPEGVIQYANTSMDALWPPPATNLQGKNIFDLIHPENVNEIRQIFEESLKSPNSQFFVQFQLRTTQQESLWLEGKIANMMSEPTIEGLMCSLRDVTERKKIHESLKENRDKLGKTLEENKRIMDNSLDVLCTINNHGKFSNLNKACKEVWGYKEAELLNKPFLDYVHEKDLQKSKVMFNDVKTGKSTTTFTNRYKHKDGRLIHIMWSAFWDEHTNEMFCVGKDVTAFIRIQKKLKLTYKRLKFHIQNSPLGTIEWDQNFQVKKWSHRAAEIFGFTFQQVAKQNPLSFNLFHPESLDEISENIKKLTAGEVSAHQMLNRNLNSKGEVLYCEWYNSVLKDEKGKVISILSLVQDVTSKKLAEENFKKEKNFVENIINSLPGIFYLFDTDGKFVRWNKNLELVTSYSGKEIATMHPLNFFHGLDRAYIEQQINEAFQVGHSLAEASISTKHGQKLPYIFTGHLFKINGTKYLIGLGLDITEKKQTQLLLEELNQSLQQRAEELANSNQDLENFAYMVSHDLQEPLRMVKSFLDLLVKKYGHQLDETAMKYIHFAVDGSERMKKLIEDLLEYSRVGTSKAEKTTVDINQIVENIKSIFHATLEERKAIVRYENLPIVKGIPVQLNQLFQNLIGNALKYNDKPQPEINIRYEETPTHHVFQILDNGIGIEPKHFDKIFIIFKRLHNRKDYSGTGIGLAICKRIVEKHGGKIWVDSAPGEGTTFSFTIQKE
jgi:PAS domain S-box-containing protein